MFLMILRSIQKGEDSFRPLAGTAFLKSFLNAVKTLEAKRFRPLAGTAFLKCA